VLRNLTAALCRQLCGSRFAALFREFDGGAFFLSGLAVFDLAGGNINDEFPELDRVAGAFEALRTHTRNMACLPGTANLMPPRGRSNVTIELTHYPETSLLAYPVEPG
jgi:hypothetical protein